jgi:hypothetical protein
MKKLLWLSREFPTGNEIPHIVANRERARYIERATTYSGLQEHRNTSESTEKALEH